MAKIGGGGWAGMAKTAKIKKCFLKIMEFNTANQNNIDKEHFFFL